jgi:SPX domain protein involved in polyphosphate accumulation
VCKTVYKRVAFQNPDVGGVPDRSVRISIDFDLEVYEIDSYTPSTETDLGFSARFKTGRVVT